MNSWSRLKQAAGLCTAGLLVVACQGDDTAPVETTEAPVVDTGVQLTDTSEEREAVVGELVESHDVAVRFEGGFDPELGFWVTPDRAMIRGAEFDEEGGLRSLDQGLFCDVRLTSGRPDTLVLTTDPGTVGSHFDGPTGVCGTGAPPLNLDYGSPLAGGALCADIRIRSVFGALDLTDVYAVITDISSETNLAYTYADFNVLGLGNGAQRPAGNGAPTDAFGGLFSFGDIDALDEAVTQWVFRFDGQPFRFSGVVVASFQETCNGEDDDCDGDIDEGAGCFPNGFACESDDDCESRDCDPSIRTCGGTSLPEICDNGIDDNGDGDIDCRDSKCSGEGTCPDFGCTNGNIGGDISVFRTGESNFSVVLGPDATTVEGELSDFTLNDAVACGSTLEGADRAFLWKAPVDGEYTFAVSSDEFDVALVVVRVDECPVDLDLFVENGQATCVDNTLGFGRETITETASEGDGFIIIIDSAIPSDDPLGYGGFEFILEKPAVCGDNYHDPYTDLLGNPGEDCDDGGVNSATCDSDCTFVACNDGILNAEAESCEDGNTTPGDGCDATCQAETGWSCPLVLGQACSEICGDGLIVGDEVCDDNNAEGGDGCAADCRAVETGFTCGAPGDACVETCNDGLVVGVEVCDDGNNDDGDGCSAACDNVEDGYRCPAAGGVCTNIDECAEGSDNCSENATCTDTPGSFTCACNSGFSGDGVTCTNIDECTEGTDTCDVNATCTDTAGDFTCACNGGYSGDGFTCVDDNECDTNPCDANASCTNTPGSFTCGCNAGYEGDGFSCNDINECGEGLDNCGANTVCTNLPSTFSCACAAGYEGDPIAGCTDINECVVANPCDSNATCTNLDGGVDCSCDAGYEGDGVSCANVDECSQGLDNCGANTVCNDLDPTLDGAPFECACAPGYEGDPIAGCTNINECALGTDNCSDNATCADTDGAFVCTCLPGFVGDGVSCDDLNECTEGLDDCDANATCQNTTGDFLCICNDGFQGTGDVCENLDECATGNDNCSADATCTDIDSVANPGQFFDCTCNAGYEGDGVTCNNINECATGADNCNVNATCTDTIGGFTCACDSGYAGDGVTCNDVNECATNNGGCSDSCVNEVGSFRCECPTGFRLDVDGLTCININECAENTDNCSPNATCTDTAGSFTCACNSGYSGNGVSCTNIDECATNTDNCSPNASCTDTPGSFTCACDSGYTGNGVSCTNINECATNNGGCSVNATCTDTPGSRTCACNTGYTGDGLTCTNVDECALGTDNCSDNATCSDTPGSWSCTCNSGFTGNGVTCTDINECASNPCAANASCNNTPGSYTCACLNGFGGDAYGAACTPVCGDGQVVGGEQCDWGQGGVAGPNAPACEASSCGYCNSSCNNATAFPTTGSCTDGSDNDSDGFTNCNDTHCAGVGSCPDWDCGYGSNAPGDRYLGTFEGTTSGSTSGASNNFTFGNGPDVRYYWVAPRSGWFLFSTCNNGNVPGSSNFDTEIGVQAGGNVCGGNPTFRVDDTSGCSGNSTGMAVNVTGGQNYSVVVDGFGSGSVGNYSLTIDDMCASVTDQTMRNNICGTYQQCNETVMTGRYGSCGTECCGTDWTGSCNCTRNRNCSLWFRRYQTADNCGCGGSGYGGWQENLRC